MMSKLSEKVSLELKSSSMYAIISNSTNSDPLQILQMKMSIFR